MRSGQFGTYGTKGTADPANIPGARYRAVSWRDSSGNLWLFGGVGFDATGNNGGDYNDLWKYNPSANAWTWVSGSNVFGQAGVYGTQGTADPANVPGARTGAVAWVDSSGKLWLFAGVGYDSTESGDFLNDLWRFDPATSRWSWVSGSKTSGQLGVYGTKGTAAPVERPRVKGRFCLLARFEQNTGSSGDGQGCRKAMSSMA